MSNYREPSSIGMMSGLRKTEQPLFGYRANPKSDLDRSDHAAFYFNQGDAIDSIGYPQYTGEQAGISGLGDAFSDIGGHNSFTEHMGVRSAGETSSDQRYQELATRADALRTEIHDLKLELNWQLKLKSNEMRNDPEWLVAKHQWIYKGDSSGLDKIMARKEAEEQRQFQAKENELNRQQTMDIAKLNKEKEQEDKKTANQKDYDTQVRLLRFALDDNKGMFNTPSARSTIFKAWNDTLSAARNLGINEDELIESIQNEYPEYGDFKAFIRQKREPAGEGAGAGEDMTQLETRFNNAKSSKDMEAILKSAEGKIDPTKKTEWEEKIKKTKDAEARRAQNRKDWETKADSTLKEILDIPEEGRQSYFDGLKRLQTYVELVDGKFRKKKNPYGGK